MTSSVGLEGQIEELFARAGIEARIHAIEACAIGGNNRTYRVQTEIGPFAAKQYFRHEGDSRNRLTSEYAFLGYAADVAPGRAPRPYARDEGSGLALYEFVEGRRLETREIGWPQVEAAVDFFVSLNRAGARAQGRLLPTAAEACFSIAEHLELVRGRIDALRTAPVLDELHREAKSFVEGLADCWDHIADSVRRTAASRSVDLMAHLDERQRCVSPSDFGFHNALAEARGTVRFLDFEYAGWDDPAKMAGDFFAQLAVPVPQELFARFVQHAMSPFPKAEDLVARASLLRPVYRIKWCCIAMNVFLAPHLARRRFANPEVDEVTLKKAQLMKARALLHSIQEAR